MRSGARTVSERFFKEGIATVVILTALMILPGIIQLNAATPLPVVHGPLPVTADSYPFGATDNTRVLTDLKKIGFIEEELIGRISPVFERSSYIGPARDIRPYVDSDYW